MIAVHLSAPDDFEAWRDKARQLANDSVSPDDIAWTAGVAAPDLFALAPPTGGDARPFPVPRDFVDLARTVICHNEPARFGLLYQCLFRLRTHSRLLEDAADPLTLRLNAMARTVRRDIHKMRAFVRFREIAVGSESRYVAWFEPDHHIVRANAGFFIRRFANMDWAILTPALSIHWDRETLNEGPPARREDAPDADAFEEQWHAYYRSIFNPARLKPDAMLKEMPRKYWRNMPETALIPDMIKTARKRTSEMIETETPALVTMGLDGIAREARKCRRCPLYQPATQMVFGEGPGDARLMLVGEQPGDEEDLAGRPFVGPAGRLLDEALREADIDRTAAYVTNAVKHFKFTPRGKRRIHARPSAGEIDHCRWWLTQEIDAVKPDLIVALGATAARSVLGRAGTIATLRGRPLRSVEGIATIVTIHPSFLLRFPDRERAAEERKAFVADLRRAACWQGASITNEGVG